MEDFDLDIFTRMRGRSLEDFRPRLRYLAVEAHMFMTGQHFVVDGFQWSC